jgi:hypothetical protein
MPIRKVHEIQAGLKLNGTHRLLVYVDVNRCDNIDTTQKNMKTLIYASKEVGLEVYFAISSPECRAKSYGSGCIDPHSLDLGTSWS